MECKTEPIGNFIADILFVVVLYRRDVRQAEALQTLLHLTLPHQSILVFDNSPNPQYIDDVRVIYRHNPDNGGVSKAYNEGYQLAATQGKRWLLFLDQDTALTRTYLESLGTATRQYPETVLFVPEIHDQKGVLSPFRWSRGKGTRTQTQAGKLKLAKYRFINSGVLVTARAFHAAGLYDEDLPLDFSDIAFGIRLQQITDHFVRTDTTLSHHFFNSALYSKHEALIRYQVFCKAAIHMGRYYGNTVWFHLRALMRGARLALRFSCPSFLRIYLSLTWR